MDKTKSTSPGPRPQVRGEEWRATIYKHRGLLLAPVALALLIFGRPSLLSAELGIGIAAVGEALRIWAVGYSGKTTRADVVTAPHLVTAGPYALLRNPLYLGNTLIAIGFTIALTGGVPQYQAFWLFVFVFALLIFVYASVVPLEEAYLASAFGIKYTEYTTLVPRIIPWRGPLDKSKQEGAWQSNAVWGAESTTLVFFMLMVIFVVLKLTVFGRFTIVF